MKKFWIENGLSIVLFLFFLVFILGLSFTGLAQENSELETHGEPALTYGQYIASGDFIEAVFENWESEFLQMGALVILTIWLKQKGSADSKRIRGAEDVDTESRYSIISASSWKNRGKAVKHAVYANSLGIALFLLFFISFVLHALSGTAAANEEALSHGEEQYNVMGYVSSARFWFESFQNWQSEFLAVGVLLILSIYLRQRKSPESKPIGEKNSKTGK